MFDYIWFWIRPPLCIPKEGPCGVLFCSLWCLCDPVSPHLCRAFFLCIFHDWKHREVKAFCMPITNNSSLHISLDICVYVCPVLTPVGTNFHAYGFWITEIRMGLMLSLQVRQCGVIYLTRSLCDDPATIFTSELLLWLAGTDPWHAWHWCFSCPILHF